MQFTQDQVQKVLKIIQHTKVETNHKVNNFIGEFTFKKTEKGKNFWILNIGATGHVTPSKSYFTSFFKIKPVIIKLRNNSHAMLQLDILELLSY